MVALERAEAARFPRVVFDAPVFRGLDERAEHEIEAAGKLREVRAGEPLYRAGDACDAFYVVASGELSIAAKRRGEDVESVLRRAQPGDALGEEAFASPRRRGSATAVAASLVAEIPVHIFRRAAVRSGKAELAERLERAMQRAAMRDLLRTTALGAELERHAFDALLDAATPQSLARGERVYRAGEPAAAMYLVADGRVQVQIDDDERVRVRGYLGPGDFFGDEEILEGDPAYRATVVASGATSIIVIPAAAARAVARDAPSVFTRQRRVSAEDRRAQGALIAGAARNATQHLFRDLYRLEIARSLLVIDLESCVRCGHCTWSCGALHGTPRLVRRGDKIVTPKGAPVGPLQSLAENAHLMLPSSCQHCENPACMVDCPTGAIGKDASGEVFIREELCTGCGACARACPWDNIQMAPRPADAPRPKAAPDAPGTGVDVAVKCDLCSDYVTGPACVEACPTDALHRIDPSNDLAELRRWLGRDAPRASVGEALDVAPAAPSFAHAAWVLGALAASIVVGFVGARMQSLHLFVPNRGVGLAAGVACAIGLVGLLAYAVPKRAIRLWKRRGPKTARARASLVKPLLTAHVAAGWMTLALGVAHAPVALGKGTAPQLLLLALALTTALGGATALAYRLVPRRLARIERTAVLPEDFAAEQRALVDRLFRSVSGRSDVVKKLAERILLPYARSRLGPLWLLLSGRDLRAEQRALERRIDAVLEGRGKDRLAGVDDLVRVVVEIRSLPAQRLLVGLLRIGLPLHVITFTAAIVLGVSHVVFGVGR